MSFKTYVSLLIFYLNDLPVYWCKWGMGVHYYYVSVNFSFYDCYHLPYILRCSYVECLYIYNCYIFLDWFFDCYIVSFSVFVIIFFLKSIFSDMSIAVPAFFWFPFAWNTYSHTHTYSLYVSLHLKWVSLR